MISSLMAQGSKSMLTYRFPWRSGHWGCMIQAGGHWACKKHCRLSRSIDMGMDQYLLIPFLGEWTSIYQLFWCSPGVQLFDTLPYVNIPVWCVSVDTRFFTDRFSTNVLANKNHMCSSTRFEHPSIVPRLWGLQRRDRRLDGFFGQVSSWL